MNRRDHSEDECSLQKKIINKKLKKKKSRIGRNSYPKISPNKQYMQNDTQKQKERERKNLLASANPFFN